MTRDQAVAACKLASSNQAVAACKLASSTHVVMSGDARQGDWDDLNTALIAAGIQVTAGEPKGGIAMKRADFVQSQREPYGE